MNSKYLMIVEDDVDIRTVMEQTLNDEGYVTISAKDGLEALSLLRLQETLPQVILLDLMMPRMDGLGFRKEQINDEKLASVPVILFSADPKAVDKASHYKIQHCLKKPVDLDALFHLISEYWAK